MRSHLFDQSHAEVEGQGRWLAQSNYMLKATLGPDVLAIKGVMVAYQGQVRFDHEGAGSIGKLMKKVLTSEDTPLMRVSGNGEVFFARLAESIFTVELDGDGITVNSTSLLAFDAAVNWDIKRVQGAGIAAGGLFNTVLTGNGTVALTSHGSPMLLDCSQQPTFVDVQAAVAWSSNLVPSMNNSMNMKSMLRGGSGEALQYVFHGPGFVVVQPSEGAPASQQQQQKQGGLGGLLGG